MIALDIIKQEYVCSCGRIAVCECFCHHEKDIQLLPTITRCSWCDDGKEPLYVKDSNTLCGDCVKTLDYFCIITRCDECGECFYRNNISKSHVCDDCEEKIIEHQRKQFESQFMQ